MKKLSIIILGLSACFCINTICYGAPDSLTNGIHFQQGLNWKQIIEKAGQEKKYILVDCFATWCGPCKKMDKEVYPLKEVGDYFNSKFISVKAQMDTAANDDADIKAFYADAQAIRRRYKIGFYPTFLIFNSEGNLLSQTGGYMDVKTLIQFAKDATDPEKDYYNLLKEYNTGRRNPIEMAFLARTADGLLGDHVEAKFIAGQYMRSLKKEDWYTEENIKFFRQFTTKSNDPGFRFFYDNAAKINKTMKDEDYTQSFINGILYKELIAPEIHKGASSKNAPNWKAIAAKIAHKYGKYYAERVTIGARADWSARKKDWPEHNKYFIKFIEKYGPKSDTGGQWESFALNNDAWDILEHSTDTSELNIALKWSLRAITIDPDPDRIDTYANILYKLKKTALALKWETIASAALNHKSKPIEATLAKMKEGALEPWKAEGN